jgi:hypothetical protein
MANIYEELFVAATGKQWTTKPDFARVRQQIREVEDRQRPGSDCVVPDSDSPIVGNKIMEIWLDRTNTVKHPGGSNDASTISEAS